MKKITIAVASDNLDNDKIERIMRSAVTRYKSLKITSVEETAEGELRVAIANLSKESKFTITLLASVHGISNVTFNAVSGKNIIMTNFCSFVYDITRKLMQL